MICRNKIAAATLGAVFGLGTMNAAQAAPGQRALEQQLENLQNEMMKVKSKIGSMEASADKGTGCDFNPKKLLAIKCANWEGQVNGRIMFDVMAFDRDSVNGIDQGGGSDLRRARINISGKLYKTWKYKLEYDLASSASIKDAYISYEGLKKKFHGFYVKVGNAHVPFSLEELTSSRHGLFLERAMTDGNAIIPSRKEGIYSGFNGANWTLNAGVHGSNSTVSGTNDEAIGTAVRVTYAPFVAKGEYYSHLGFGYRYMNPNGDTGTTTFESESPFASNIMGTKIYNTGVIANTNDYTVLNPELALGWKSLGLQGEYFYTQVNRGLNGSGTQLDDLDFNSWYIQANWWITGEMNNYSGKKGKFGRVKPLRNLSDGGPGAWGVALRYQGVNFTDGDPTLAPIQGGGSHALTTDLTWKPNPYVKFRAEYVKVWRDNDACTACAAANETDSPSAVQFQALVDF